MVRGAVATVGGTTVELAESSNTDVLAQVDVAGDGGRADVVPVLGVGSQLLGRGGLDRVNPGGDLELAYVQNEAEKAGSVLVFRERGEFVLRKRR